MGREFFKNQSNLFSPVQKVKKTVKTRAFFDFFGIFRRFFDFFGHF